MTPLILGVLAWSVVHLFPIWARPTRNRVFGALGEWPYRALFALVTLGTVALTAYGYRQAPVVNLWFPPSFMVHLNNILMVVAVPIFIAGAVASPVRRWIRHPQLIGVKIWALAHLLANGDLASVILFGGCMAWAVVALIGTNRRDGPRVDFPHVHRIGVLVHVLLAGALFCIVAFLHFRLGVWPFPGGPPG